MPLSHDEFTRFKTYQPRGWKFSRLSASAESLEKKAAPAPRNHLFSERELLDLNQATPPPLAAQKAEPKAVPCSADTWRWPMLR